MVRTWTSWRSERALLLATAAIGSACVGTTQETTPSVTGAVTGQVRRQSGTAVGGALLGFTLTTQPVGGTATLLSSASLTADDQGNYTLVFIVPGAAQTAVLSVAVTPPIGSGLLGKDTSGLALRLSTAYPPPDTTYLFFDLAPRQ